MSTFELHLDELSYARAKHMAEARNVSVEQWASEAIERFSVVMPSTPPERDSMIGLFADAPELLDQIVEQAYKDREQIPWRIPTE